MTKEELSTIRQLVTRSESNSPQVTDATATSVISPVPPAAATASVPAAAASKDSKVASDMQAELNRLAAGKPVKLIIDTDIGTDCDDVLALLTCLNIPSTDVDLLGITTCYHPTLLRKHVAQSILRAAGGRFAHIPVLAGPSRLCGTHRSFFHNGNEGEGLDLSEGDKAALWEEQQSNEAI